MSGGQLFTCYCSLILHSALDPVCLCTHPPIHTTLQGIRLPTHPTSSRPSGVLNATSLPSSNSQNTDRSVRLGEQTVDESSQRQLHTDYPTDKNRFSRARMAGFPCNFSDPVECENSGLKWSGARWNLRSPTADKLDQRSGKDEDVQVRCTAPSCHDWLPGVFLPVH